MVYFNMLDRFDGPKRVRIPRTPEKMTIPNFPLCHLESPSC